MTRKILLSIAAIALSAGMASAQETRAQVYADIQKTFGSVPSFAKQIPDAALAGIWQETKTLEMSGDTALDTKTKALISLAVAAQIPCQYCVWMDTRTAKQAGATDEEIGEAIAEAGLTRNWSTIFNGLGLDFNKFKAELGGS